MLDAEPSNGAGSSDTTRRELRQRTAQAPYRPRPQLTSSNRGKANAQLRRQRELEANQVFSEANDLITNVRHASSSSNAAMSEEREQCSDQESEACDVSGVQEGANDPRSSEERRESGREEREVTRLLASTESHDSHSPSQTNPDATDWIDAAPEDALDSVDAEPSSMKRMKLSQTPPFAKRARLDDVEFDEDDGFFEQIIATEAIDWDQPSQPRASAGPSTSPAPLRTSIEPNEWDDIVRKNREEFPATEGFRWCNKDKSVFVKQSALAKAREILARTEAIGGETDSPSHFAHTTAARAPFATPSSSIIRPALGDVTNVRLNVEGQAAHAASMHASKEGKQKVVDEMPVATLPATPLRIPSVVGTALIEPALSPRTPLPRRSVGRLGSALRSSSTQRLPALPTPTRASSTAPQTPRVVLGMTPRRLHSGSVPRFKIPFMNPSKAATLMNEYSPKPQRLSLADRGISAPSVMKTEYRENHSRQVFNLERNGSQRDTLKALGIRPESTTMKEATRQLSEDDCDAVRQILSDPTKAKRFAFEVEGGLCSVGSVQVMLRDVSGSQKEVPRAWAENHYIHVLWKLAAYTRHLLDDRFWNWEEVCRQMRYRYEREYNCQHRSAVKHLMRHCSTPKKGLVLCVFSVSPFDTGKDAEQFIVLTDGWYRIKAELDRVLTLAVYGKQSEQEAIDTRRIRLKVGSKVALQGFQVDSCVELAEPAKGLDGTVLKLTGNTTKLARWDSKLGFADNVFISTIRSLSAEGGCVPLMDFVVTCVYPIAFSGRETCPGFCDRFNLHFDEWNPEEEQVRQAAWEKHVLKMRAQAQAEADNDLAVFVRICEELEQACEGLSVDSSYGSISAVIESSSLQKTLECMILAKGISTYKGLSAHFPTLRILAYKRLEQEREKVAAGLTNTLQARVGSRQIRSFRMIRVRDATHADYGREGEVSEKRKQCKRSALIKVWDYLDRAEGGGTVPAAEGEHFLVSGERPYKASHDNADILWHQVSNLMPSRTKGWSGMDENGDVDLTSGKASQWQRVPVRTAEDATRAMTITTVH